MAIKDKLTTHGGSRGYNEVRSKYVKGKDHYGKVITQARENLIASDPKHRDPGPETVASHVNFGAHHGSDQDAYWATRGRNTAESNMNRADGISPTDKLKLKMYKSPTEEPKKFMEKINARRGKPTRQG